MLVSMTRALLVIDVQESFRQAPLWATISNPAIASDVARLVDGARANGDFVVWVLHSEPGSGDTFDPASGHVRYIDPLKPQAGEPELTKTSHNAFTTTNLQQLLTQHGVSEVIVCGIRTEQCCETTARLASDLGYDVTFVTEATATNPIAHRDAPEHQPAEQLLSDPRTLPASAVIERTEYALAGRFATIATIAEATALFNRVIQQCAGRAAEGSRAVPGGLSGASQRARHRPRPVAPGRPGGAAGTRASGAVAARDARLSRSDRWTLIALPSLVAREQTGQTKSRSAAARAAANAGWRCRKSRRT
jgi:nicotinamidase-related amidase